MIQIQIELRDAPDALAPTIVDDNDSRPQAEFTKVGTRMLAAAGPCGRFRENLDDVDVAEFAGRLGLSWNLDGTTQRR